jgi:hypothetical protein
MGHLLKIKCVDSRGMCTFYLQQGSHLHSDGASAKFSSDSHETDYSVDVLVFKKEEKSCFDELEFADGKRILLRLKNP